MIRERRPVVGSPFCLGSFPGRGISSATQEGEFADVAGIEDVNPSAHVNDDSGFILGEENLFRVANDDYFAIHAKLKRAEWSRLQRSLEIHRFHAVNLAVFDISARLSPWLKNSQMTRHFRTDCAAGRNVLARKS
jgi:hypothetical protein